MIISTHNGCNLNIPWLPHEMTQAYMVPGLTHASLVFIKTFCDGGKWYLKVMYIRYNTTTDWFYAVTETPDPGTGLWT